MYRLKEMICNEIKEIEDKGIKTSNVALLGDLIDMYKDLVNVDYWDYKMHTKKEESMMEKVQKVHMMYENKQKGIPVNDDELHEYLHEMLTMSEKIGDCLKKFKLSADMQAMYDRVFR